MKEKYIAVDLDGTLLSGNGRISEVNIDAIKHLAKAGIKTIVLTGRTFYEIPPEIRTCEGIEYFVFSDGAGVRHLKKGILHYTPILKEVAIRIFDILRSYTCFVELYSNGHPYVNKAEFNDEMLEYYNIDSLFIPTMQETRFPVDDIEKLLYDDAYKIEMFDVFFKYDSHRKECLERFRSEYSGLEITTSMDNNLEILKKGINKGYGLLTLCKKAKFDIEDVIVIGDSKNDISAFKIAKTKYAVSNACDEIKAIADKIICSNDENIMVYMEKELL